MKEEKKNHILEELELQIAECFHNAQRITSWIEYEMNNLKNEAESTRDFHWRIASIKAIADKLVDYQARWEQQRELADFAQHMHDMVKGGSNE